MVLDWNDIKEILIFSWFTGWFHLVLTHGECILSIHKIEGLARLIGDTGND